MTYPRRVASGSLVGPKGDRGIPGADAVPTAEAVDAYLAAGITDPGLADGMDRVLNDTGSGPRATMIASIAARTGVTVSIANYPHLEAAIDALPPTGGTVFVPVGRWLAGPGGVAYAGGYMDKPNVRVVGAKLPRVSATADRLEAGSVIAGTLVVFADGFETDAVGYDLGKATVDTYLGGADTHTGGAPTRGDWTPLAIAQPNQVTPLPGRRGVRIGSVIALSRDSQSLGHSILVEGCTGVTIDHAVGVGSYHGVAVKSRAVKAGALSGWATSKNAVIVKADSYAPAGDVTVKTVESLTDIPGVTPGGWWTPVASENALMLQAYGDDLTSVQVDTVRNDGAWRSVYYSGGPSVHEIVDPQIGQVLATNESAHGSLINGVSNDGTAHVRRPQIGRMIVTGASASGIEWADTEGDLLMVGDLRVQACRRALSLIGASRVKIDSIRGDDLVYVYNIEADATFVAGIESIGDVEVQKWENVVLTGYLGWAGDAAQIAVDARDAAEAARDEAETAAGLTLAAITDTSRIPEDLGDVPGWDAVTTTADGWLLAGLRSSGEPYSRSTSVGAPAVDAGDIDLAGGFAHAVFDTTGTYLTQGVLTDGTPYFHRARIDHLEAGGSLSGTRPLTYAAFGDSMIGGGDSGGGGLTVGGVIGDTLALPTFNGGHSGYTSTEVAFCAGAIEVWATITGGTIPSSGSVGVTIVDPTETWKVGSARSFTVLAVLEDGTTVTGTLAKSASEVWTFTAAGLSSSAAAPREILLRQAERVYIPEGRGVICWMGRNTVSDFADRSLPLAGSVDVIVRDYVAMRDHVYANSLRPRFLGVPVHNRSDMGIGVGEYATIIDIRDALADTLGADFYDLRRWYITNGIYAAGITPTSQDLLDIAADVVPTSLRQTGGAGINHYIEAGRVVLGQRLAYVATNRDWKIA